MLNTMHLQYHTLSYRRNYNVRIYFILDSGENFSPGYFGGKPRYRGNKGIFGGWKQIKGDIIKNRGTMIRIGNQAQSICQESEGGIFVL